MNPLVGMNQSNNPMQMLQLLKQNPSEMLRKRGLNIPNGMSDPNQIINHLLTSGQLSQSRLGQIQKMAEMFGRR